MPETYRTINELLKPLEMHLEQNSYNKHFKFYHDKIEIGQLHARIHSISILEMPNLKHVIYCLLNAKYFSAIPFFSEDQFHIDNPYFGCKNLEEALIIKDLIVKTEQ